MLFFVVVRTVEVMQVSSVYGVGPGPDTNKSTTSTTPSPSPITCTVLTSYKAGALIGCN